MSERFLLNYELHKHGWATATIAQGKNSVSMTVSYVHDSLRELANAAYNLSKDSKFARVVFMDEPGEHQIVFEKLRFDELEYTITWFHDWDSWGIKTIPGSEKLFTGKISPHRLVHQVNAILWKLLNEHGESGYKERWGQHDFPTNEMNLLASIKSENAG